MPIARELEAAFDPVTSLSCLFKHRGFHEEREVRIVAIPLSEELTLQARLHGEVRPMRQRKTFLRGGTPVPYLDLFAAESALAGVQLPITRVIVGPHFESERRRASVREMLRTREIDAEVRVSEIPYVGS